MSILRYQPTNWLRELQHELFENQAKCGQELAWYPKVDIKENEKEYVIYADLPGIEPDAIEIEMDSNTLTIKGERKTVKEEKEENFYRVERSEGKFYRQFTLPETVASDKISAKSKNGVLAIHLPKAIETKAQRKITVVSQD